MKEPILVTGVGGKIGGIGQKIVFGLRKRNLPVRAFLRTADPAFEAALKRAGVEIAVGDLTNLGNVHKAVEGCKRLYFGMSVSPAYLEATTNTAAVAKHHEIECFVNISQMTVSQMSVTKTTDSPQQKLHWLSEQVLNWSGLPVVHVRPTVFLEHFFFRQWAAESIQKFNEIRLPFGAIKTSPIATDDVARVMVEILANPKGHVGNVYELTGRKSLTMLEIAHEYSLALGREIKFVEIPFESWNAELFKRGLPEHVAAHFSAMARLHRDNRYDRLTNDVQKITGSQPISVREWVEGQKDYFLGAR